MALKNRNPHKCTFSLWEVIAATVIALLFATSIFYVVVPAVVKYLITQETQLLNGTRSWEKWTNPKLPIFFKIHMFNVTNADEAQWGGKFQVEDVGPYVWEQKRHKEIVQVDVEEDTVTYKEIVRYYFRPDLSNGTERDTVNMMNVPFLVVSTLAQKIFSPSLADFVVDMFVEANENFVRRDLKVGDLIFDGVELDELYSTVASLGIADLPDEFTDGFFAFYNNKNATPSQEFKISRGIKDHNDFGRFISSDGKKELDWWTNTSLPADAEQKCNKISGTDGAMFAPFITKDQDIQFFFYEICRSLYATFGWETNFHHIPAYVFVLPESVFDFTHSNKNNECFCLDPGYGLANTCIPGTMRMFSCKQRMPILLSYPHFLHADAKLLNGVDGLMPNRNIHESSITLEPNSGAVLQLVTRFQISAEFQRLPGITAFSNITEAYIPIFWVETFVELEEEDITYIRQLLVTPFKIISIVKPSIYGFIALASISAIIAVLFRGSRNEPLLYT